MNNCYHFTVITFVLLLLFPVISAADYVEPAEKGRCHVCGMPVKKNPGWIAQIVFTDSTRASFDGPKDMFRYMLNLKKYNHKKSADDIARIYVKGYLGRMPIDASKSFYVIHSHVMGPMGHELVPFATKDDAEEFAQNRGGRVVSYEEVTLQLIKDIERGHKDH